MKIPTFRLHAYGVSYAAVFSQREFDALLAKKNLEPPTSHLMHQTDAACHFWNRDGGLFFVAVAMNGKKAAGRTRIEVTGLMVHEAVHIWQNILLKIGEKSPGEEIEAYHVQSITQNLLWALQQWKKNKRKQK